MSEVFTTDEFDAWLEGLSDPDAESVGFVVELLASSGLSLGSPYSSAIRGATFALRELRPKAGRSPLRVFYAYDRARDAVLILGGDKGSEPDFYPRFIAKCEAIWKQYLDEREAERTDEDP